VREREFAAGRDQPFMHGRKVLARHVQFPAELTHIVDPMARATVYAMGIVRTASHGKASFDRSVSVTRASNSRERGPTTTSEP